MVNVSTSRILGGRSRGGAGPSHPPGFLYFTSRLDRLNRPDHYGVGGEEEAGDRCDRLAGGGGGGRLVLEEDLAGASGGWTELLVATDVPTDLAPDQVAETPPRPLIIETVTPPPSPPSVDTAGEPLAGPRRRHNPHALRRWAEPARSWHVNRPDRRLPTPTPSFPARSPVQLLRAAAGELRRHLFPPNLHTSQPSTTQLPVARVPSDSRCFLPRRRFLATLTSTRTRPTPGRPLRNSPCQADRSTFLTTLL